MFVNIHEKKRKNKKQKLTSSKPKIRAMAKYETWMRALLSDSGIEGCAQRTWQEQEPLLGSAAHLETKLRLSATATASASSFFFATCTDRTVSISAHRYVIQTMDTTGQRAKDKLQGKAGKTGKKCVPALGKGVLAHKLSHKQIAVNIIEKSKVLECIRRECLTRRYPIPSCTLSHALRSL